MIARLIGLKFLAIFLFFNRKLVRADFIATLNSCPANYQRVSNGCYFFSNSTAVDRDTANYMCNTSLAVSSTVPTHLLSIESLAESIALSYWVRGLSYTTNFWTDGERLSMYTRVWSWSLQDYYGFGYIQDSGLTNKEFMYLFYNSTGGYEFRDNDGSAGMSYICEAQVPCQPSDNVCQNNGTCYVNSGRVLCICIDGFVGELCEMETDNCDSAPCLHGATCTNEVNNYTCTCTSFYSGRNCDIAIPDQFQNVITLVVALFISFILLILLILCLMDLPLDIILMRLFPKKFNKNYKKKAEEIKLSQEKSNLEKVSKAKKPVESKAPSKAQLLHSEQEMLKRFRSAIMQTQGGGQQLRY